METWQLRTEGWLHDDNNIKGFFGPYRWLSNFHLCPVSWQGILYPSSENAYQAAKCMYVEERAGFIHITPSQAKNRGRAIKMRTDWLDVRLVIMRQILYDKFTRNPDLKDMLLSTGNKYLEETNWWRDEFWGVCKGIGLNNLGRILMDTRIMIAHPEEE